MAAPASGPLKALPPNLRALDVSRVIDDKVSWTTWSHELGALAVNLAVALLILVITVWAARGIARLVRGALVRAQRHDLPDATVPSFAASLVRYAVLAIGAMAALEQLGVRTTSVLAIIGAASLAIGLALQGALGNVAAGVMILLFRPYRVGDFIDIGGKQGTVRSLDLFITELATADNLRVMAPNGKVFGDFIVNYTHHPRRRVDVVFHVDPKRELTAVLDGLKAFAAQDARVLKTPPPIFEAMALNELYAEGAARVWVKTADYARMRSDLVLKVQGLALAPAPAQASPPP